MWPWLKKHKKETILVGGAVIVYIALCTYQLSDASLWFDEAYSAWIVNLDPMRLLGATAADIHPPLYYLLLQVWTFLFGSSEFSLRFLSVLFGAAVVVMSYGIARHIVKSKYAWILPYLVAISPVLVRYGREARMYTLLTLLVMASVYLLIIAVSRSEKRLWRIHGVVVGLGMLTHYLMPIFWVAQWAWVAWQEYQKGARTMGQVVFSSHWRTSCLAVLVVAGIWLPIMIAAAITRQITGFWIPPVTFEALGSTITRMFMYQPVGQLAVWQLLLACVFIIGIGIAMYVVRKKRSFNGRLVWLSVIIPPILLALLSIPPMVSKYYDRYLLPSMVLGALCIGLVFIQLITYPRRFTTVLAGVLAGIYVAMSTVGIMNVYTLGNYNQFDGTTSVKQVMQDIGRLDKNAPIYVMNSSIAASVQYYAERDGLKYEEWSTLSEYDTEDIRQGMEELQHRYQGHTVWVIDHIRPTTAAGGARLLLWERVPQYWKKMDVVEYDYSSNEPSYRAVRYTVTKEHEF